MVSLDPLFLIGVGISKHSWTSKSTVLVETAEWAMSFKKRTRKERFLGEMSSNEWLKAPLRQSLSDICSAKNLTAQDVLFQILWYQTQYRAFLFIDM